MSTELSEKIHKLRADGLSYRQIQSELACSKGTISYHLGKNQKEKTRLRLAKRRAKHPYVKKVETFTCGYKQNKPTRKELHKYKKLIQLKIELFFRDRGDRKNMKYQKPEFTVDDVIQKFGENPNCYLSGDPIDIYKPRTYHFDHIHPISRGGNNSIDNLGICTRAANMAKSDLTVDELIELCQKILSTHARDRT